MSYALAIPGEASAPPRRRLAPPSGRRHVPTLRQRGRLLLVDCKRPVRATGTTKRSVRGRADGDPRRACCSTASGRRWGTTQGTTARLSVEFGCLVAVRAYCCPLTRTCMGEQILIGALIHQTGCALTAVVLGVAGHEPLVSALRSRFNPCRSRPAEVRCAACWSCSTALVALIIVVLRFFQESVLGVSGDGLADLGTQPGVDIPAARLRSRIGPLKLN